MTGDEMVKRKEKRREEERREDKRREEKRRNEKRRKCLQSARLSKIRTFVIQ